MSKVQMLLHTGERPCKPKFFDNAYRNKNDHNIHMLSHIGEKPYRCDFCDKPFCRDKEFIRYMPYYAGGKPYRGISCDKTLNIGNKFIIHVPPHTGEKTYLRFNFSGSILCIKTISMYAYHRKLERNIIDATCDGAFRDKVRRRIHMPSHTGEGPYQCNMSGGAF